jgi:hypothetical protein
MARSKRPEGTRNPNGQGSLYYSEYDGYWHASVTVGVLDNGKPDRRHIKRRNEDDAREEYRKLLNERDRGTVRRPGHAWTIEKWLIHWVENIAPIRARYKAVTGYKTAVYRHLVPGLGAHRMARVEPDHFERLYARMLEAGLKPGTVHQVHRTVRTAFGAAEPTRDRVSQRPRDRTDTAGGRGRGGAAGSAGDPSSTDSRAQGEEWGSVRHRACTGSPPGRSTRLQVDDVG